MNDFDTTIQTFLTHITFGLLMNHAIRVIAGLYTFKGFVLIPVCWLWFQPGPNRERQRELVVATIASGRRARVRPAARAGAAVPRAADLQPRPAPALSVGGTPRSHAAGMEFVSERSRDAVDGDRHRHLHHRAPRRLFALLYAVVFICVPRAYLGFHYPTDLIAGAAIGIALAWLLTRDAIRSRFAPQVLAMIALPAPPTRSRSCASS